MAWWKENPRCDHCNSIINDHQKMIKLGNKKYHQSCAFLKESVNHQRIKTKSAKIRKDDPRIKH